MSMTQKDYELIAGAIGGNEWVDEEEPSVISLIVGLAIALQEDNPKFKREKFLKQCGVTL